MRACPCLKLIGLFCLSHELAPDLNVSLAVNVTQSKVHIKIRAKVDANLVTRSFENFDLSTLVIDSEVLKSNPLGDSAVRHLPVLVPKGSRPSSGWPVVLMLSGFTGNGPYTFNLKAFETGAPEILDRALGNGEAPRALFVFCDAMTAWGGSQFLDSEGMGHYASYILDEVCAAISEEFGATEDSKFWCVMGGSSGGYGALHLATLDHPVGQKNATTRFGIAVAIAPDCFFEASLIPELRTAIPLIKKMGGISKVRDELKQGKLSRRKEWHVILNAIAMGLCYAPLKSAEPVWPIDGETGLIMKDVWAEWLKHDPLTFLKSRSGQLKNVKFYLDVGDRDQFQLQYGTRQIRDLLKSMSGDVHYVGFEGSHFDIGERRLPAWTWLSQQWRV